MTLSGAPTSAFRLPEQRGPLISLQRAGLRLIPLPATPLAPDFEGIDRLADGKLVFLSERLRSLVGEDGPIAEYDSLLGEFANRGLGGVAVRPLPGGVSRIAVLWEGGYPDYASVPWSVRDVAGRQAMRPLVVVHDLNSGIRGVDLKMRDAWLAVELEVPKPAGEEPEAQRFRAPDLVWTRSPGSSPEDWIFLVLIASEDSVERPQYLYHWLQRFDLKGKPVGEAARSWLNSSRRHSTTQTGKASPGLSRARAWCLCMKATAGSRCHAFILNLPEDWQYVAAESH